MEEIENEDNELIVKEGIIGQPDQDISISYISKPIKNKVCYYHPINLEGRNLNDDQKLLDRTCIKLLTYNLFLRPPLIHNNEDDYKNERLNDFLNFIDLYDILCLQEVFGLFNIRKDTLIREATKRGFFYFVDTSTPNFISRFLSDSGQVILSRFPIQIHSFHEFYYGVVSDSYSRKGILYAKILFKGMSLHLFTVHLQSSYFNISESQFKATLDTRMNQIGQINEFVRLILDKSGFVPGRDKILLCGDMNVDALGYRYRLPIHLQSVRNIQNEYERMLELLNSNGLIVVDTYRKYKGFSPITYAAIDPDLGYTERVLTDNNDAEARQSFDYIFEIFYGEEPSTTSKLKFKSESLKVEDFRIARPEILNLLDKKERKRPYSQLSDHYGVSVELEYIND